MFPREENVEETSARFEARTNRIGSVWKEAEYALFSQAVATILAKSLPFAFKASRQPPQMRTVQCEQQNRAPASSTLHAMQATGCCSFLLATNRAWPVKQSSWLALMGGAGMMSPGKKSFEYSVVGK